MWDTHIQTWHVLIQAFHIVHVGVLTFHVSRHLCCCCLGFCLSFPALPLEGRWDWGSSTVIHTQSVYHRSGDTSDRRAIKATTITAAYSYALSSWEFRLVTPRRSPTRPLVKPWVQIEREKRKPASRFNPTRLVWFSGKVYGQSCLWVSKWAFLWLCSFIDVITPWAFASNEQVHYLLISVQSLSNVLITVICI